MANHGKASPPRIGWARITVRLRVARFQAWRGARLHVDALHDVPDAFGRMAVRMRIARFQAAPGAFARNRFSPVQWLQVGFALRAGPASGMVPFGARVSAGRALSAVERVASPRSQRTRRGFWRASASVVAAVSLLASACSSGGTSASPTAAPADASTAAPAAAAKPTSAPTTAAAATALGVPAQPTAAPAVATSAAAPAATAAAAVPATRAAAAPATSAPIAAATSATPAAATAPGQPAATITLKGAYAQASSIQGALYVGREKGMFARHGLNVELSQVGGTQQVAALLSGDIQFGALGANEVANADLRGADLVMIATCSDLPIFSLFADKKYTSVPELAGQSIGVTNAGSATDAAAHLFLKQFDMLDKVKIIPAGGSVPAILAALGQGNIAGGILSPPTTARAEEAGYTELVNGTKLGVPMNHSGIGISRGFLKDHTDAVKNFVAAYQEAWTFTADPANKAEVVAVLAQYTQSDDRLAEIGYQAMVPVWSANKTPRVNPQAVANLLQVSGTPDAATAQPEQFIDNSLIDAIAPPG